MVVSVEKLYTDYDVLSAGKASEAELQTAFKEILGAVKGDTKAKQLACQFIVKFYKKFPALESQAIDAQLDLCEDEDQSIRRYAIKELPNFCKDNPENVSKVADILSQLLDTDDNVELVVVQGSLYQLLKANPKECLNGVFQQLANPADGEEASVREKTCKFISSKLATFGNDELSAETEKYIVMTVKKLMASADPCTFAALLGILAVLKSMKLLTTRQQMIEVIEAKAGTNLDAKAFESNKAITSFYMCCEQALPFFSKNVSSHKFAITLCEKVMPAAMKKYAASSEEPKDLPSKTQMLKLLAELSTHSSSEQVTLVTIQYLFQVLLDLMPIPPEALASGDDAFSDVATSDLSAVECAIYAFHLLSASHKDFFTAPEAQARMTDLRKRLQYFALAVQSHTKKLNEGLKAVKDAESDEALSKKELLVVCSNISTIIKDLFRIPPQHTAVVTLSWKTPAPAAPVPEQKAPGQKRQFTPISGPAKDTSNGVTTAKMSRPYNQRGGYNNRGRGGYGGYGRGRGFNRGGYRY
ncbi:apoptosis inhibitor 5-like [Convolutriloba macropyga]|uniref:apoptosis inhibitor 5-like n=1 Tax=Convolutriloba macropyga TaxID=536237 RepID=UPI003F523E8C